MIADEYQGSASSIFSQQLMAFQYHSLFRQLLQAKQESLEEPHRSRPLSASDTQMEERYAKPVAVRWRKNAGKNCSSAWIFKHAGILEFFPQRRFSWWERQMQIQFTSPRGFSVLSNGIDTKIGSGSRCNKTYRNSMTICIIHVTS